MNYNFLIKLPLYFSLTIALISCDDDLSTVGGQVIDTIPGNGFTNEDVAITAYNEVIQRVQVNGLPGVLLGQNQDDVFGSRTYNVLSQVGLSAYGLPKVDATAVLDSVVVTIPYFSTVTNVTLDENQNVNTTYTLDSIRNPGGKINLSLIPSNYFLGNFDENDLENTKKYFDDEFDDGTGAIKIPSLGNPLFTEEITLTPKEVITTIPKCEEGEEKTDEVIVKSAPAIRISMSKGEDKYTAALDFFNERLLQKIGSTELNNQTNFQAFFKGFYLKADPSTTDALAYLALNQTGANQASIILHYTEIDKTKENKCLNKIKKTVRLNFEGNVLNLAEGNLEPTVTTDIQSQNRDTGSDKIYLKGGSGAIGVIKLFSETPEILDELKEDNAIINNAVLRFYIDEKTNIAQLSEDARKALMSQRIFIYNYETGTPLADFIAAPQVATSNPQTSYSSHLGLLQQEDDAYFFDIRITQHVKNLIYNNEGNTNPLLAICVTPNTELPLISTREGIIVDPNTIKTVDIGPEATTNIPVGAIIDPDGLVLVGNNTTDAKKLKLILTYTQPIN